MDTAKRFAITVFLCRAFLWDGALLLLLADKEALFNSALGQYRLGEHALALTNLQEALKTAPDFAPAHELMGLIFSALGRKPEALFHLRHAAELWPNHAV